MPVNTAVYHRSSWLAVSCQVIYGPPGGDSMRLGNWRVWREWATKINQKRCCWWYKGILVNYNDNWGGAVRIVLLYRIGSISLVVMVCSSGGIKYSVALSKTERSILTHCSIRISVCDHHKRKKKHFCHYKKIILVMYKHLYLQLSPWLVRTIIVDHVLSCFICKYK